MEWMFSKNSSRSLEFEKFFHHCWFFLIAKTIQEPICYLYWGFRKKSESRTWSKVFFALLANKYNSPEDRQYIVIRFFFRKVWRNLSCRPFLFVREWQFLRYLAVTPSVSRFWRGNTFKHLSCDINFPISTLVKSLEFQYN